MGASLVESLWDVGHRNGFKVHGFTGFKVRVQGSGFKVRVQGSNLEPNVEP
jgi:hypothetical protein